MRLEDMIRRAEELISKADDVLKTTRERANYEFVDDELFRGFRAAALSFLAAAFGRSHTFYTEFEAEVGSESAQHARAGRGILSAAREEMVGGWVSTTKGLVSAEIFADFLEMAEHLLDHGYKDAAAVMVGSVLEEHLRQLCGTYGIVLVVGSGRTTPKKADVLNADLVKAGAYNVLDQKNVTAWLDLRNKAAHGRYDEYSKEHVVLMYQGVANFMARVGV